MWLFPKKYRHEVFISHEIEMRGAIADELRTRLVDAGLEIWYSGDQLVTGDDLEKAIKEAIENSRFGVAIFTNSFITRQWPLTELAWLKIKESDNVNVILPVLHSMTIEELRVFDPKIALKFCIHANRGMDYVVKKILEQIHLEREKERKRRQKIIALTSLVAFIFLFLSGYASFLVLNDHPSSQQIQSVVNERINECLATVNTRYARELKSDGLTINQSQIDSVWLAYDNFKSYYRNEYEINNNQSIIRGRGNVEDYIGRDPALMRYEPGYGMDSVDMFWANKTIVDGFRHSGFSLLNKRLPKFTWQGHKNGSSYVVEVTYTNEIRYINVSLTLPPAPNGTKRHEMGLVGFAPSEAYYFEKGPDGVWYFKKVEKLGNRLP